MPGTLKTITLGCKVNQYETQYVREGLEGIGYRAAAEGEAADLCIVNTCTVTGEGDAKSRQLIRRLHREQPEARIVVMGCYATRAPEEVGGLPGVAEVVTDKRELPDLLGRFGVIDIPTGISGLDGRHRAYVKVQDGCLLRCSYCIIPAVRPQMYSRSVTDIVDECRRIIDRGYREIVLTGVHLGHFGVDQNFRKPKSEWVRLANLVRQLAQLPGEFRLRLSSIEATEVTKELLEVMGEHADKVCPHFHICMQSGSEEILRRMKRRWGARRFVDCCRRIQETLIRPALTTDVIVGFPGETEAHFAETVQACRDAGFLKIHAFPFSARKGTPAASYPDQLPKAVKTERVHQLGELEKELRANYFAQLVGTQLTVLVEKEQVEANGQVYQHQGTACRYTPVRFESSDSKSGRLVPVRIMSAETDCLVGEQVSAVS